MGDLRYAIRLLFRSPGFTVVTVLSLAISIGASTALFSVVDAVLLRMLPVKEPDRLVSVSLGGWGERASYRAFEALRDGSAEVLVGLAAYSTRPLTMGGGEVPERVEGAFVSGTFFSTVDVPLSLGRVLTPQDDRNGAGGGVVVSHAFWQHRFGSDPSVLGRALRINGHLFPVVGVAPAGFFGVEIGRAIDIYLPLTAAAEIGALDRGMMTGASSTWLRLIGRPAPGVDERRAAAALTVSLQNFMRSVLNELERSSGASPERRQRLLAWQATLHPVGRGYGTVLRSRLATPLAAATVLVGLMLLLVSANIASLLMGRTVARSREVAIRLSLGAGRARIARQVLTIKTLEQQIDESIWAERLLARVAGGFGITTLVLAGVGLFGTLSQTVARRTKEIGIRMALGADVRTIRRGVVRESLVLCALGAFCGAPFAIVASRSLTRLLYGVAPGDWRALLVAAAMLGMTAALAAYLPAHRASQVDPMDVLRAE